MRFGYAKEMKMNGLIRLTLMTALLAPAPVHAQASRHAEQDAARKAMLDGAVMPFSIIKRRVDREMGDSSYLGSEFLARSNKYRLKYVKDGRVVWVDVDGRTGDILAWAR
jgi:uncharacterized membrane protein YkoI